LRFFGRRAYSAFEWDEPLVNLGVENGKKVVMLGESVDLLGSNTVFGNSHQEEDCFRENVFELCRRHESSFFELDTLEQISKDAVSLGDPGGFDPFIDLAMFECITRLVEDGL
jgi:hypothetical protein